MPLLLLPDSAYMQLADDLKIARLINGLWQVSGAHGKINPVDAIREMVEYHHSGYTTWDAADHYGPAENLIGILRTKLAEMNDKITTHPPVAFTKWVPHARPHSPSEIRIAIDKSRDRMKVDSIDLLQFHWWDYSMKEYIDILQELSGLRDDGTIRYLGLTNFDTARVKEITGAGINIISNQVQFSIIDRRPEIEMIPLARKQDFKLLAYGTLLGGFLSEKYVGMEEPRRSDLTTASLMKYKRMINAWGSWELFQELLEVLRDIARKHDVSIPNVATRYILDKPTVAGVIIGARLSIHNHMEENALVFSLDLDKDDRERIDAFQDRSRDIFSSIGDCGDEYR